MMIYPAVHYTWEELGLIITYKLQFLDVSLLESNFSDHGANRLGASALMQGLADGYFVLPIQ
jgi:succinate dehydrogenase / fumarate reductase flavoprotein subunit